MIDEKVYDCIIIGGGLAGLSLSILLAQNNRKVLLIEKKSYPYHKVCGEYVSMESWQFLQKLGIPLPQMNLPMITKLKITNTSGNVIEQALDMGGFGISRYTLDNMLADIAKNNAVTLLTNTTCTKYEKWNDLFIVKTHQSKYKSKIVCASFGRNSFGNFYKQKKNSKNWVGVKYHIELNSLENEISLHTFDSGYCGISKIENNTFCLCYIVNANSLKKFNNKIDLLEKNVLMKNPFLFKIFNEANFLFEKPITISNITFEHKKAIDKEVFYIGDAAGSIAPLTGNGMSNAMRSAYLLSIELNQYFDSAITFEQLKGNYTKIWDSNFSFRIKYGKHLQSLFCKPIFTSLFFIIAKKSKSLRQLLVKNSHGEIF